MGRNWMITAASVALMFVVAPSLGAQAPTGVRGVIQSKSGQKMVIQTADGLVHVTLAAGAQAFSRVPAKQADMGPNSFVGITSVKAADGAETATEIHIFPASLNGLGEGSRMMGTNGPGGRPNRMTNGTVQKVGTSQPNRMTNGSVKQLAHGVVTLAYKGGTRTIIIPDKVNVTMITAVPMTQLKPNTSVFALGTKQKDGTWLIDRLITTK